MPVCRTSLILALLALCFSVAGCDRQPDKPAPPAAAPTSNKSAAPEKPIDAVAPPRPEERKVLPPSPTPEAPTGASPLDQLKREADDMKSELEKRPPEPKRWINNVEDDEKRIAQANKALENLQQLERAFRKKRDRIRFKAEMVLGDNKPLATDPLAATWRSLDDYKGPDRDQMFKIKDELALVEQAVKSGEPYDPDKVQIAESAIKWAKAAAQELQGAVSDADTLYANFRKLPIFFARSFEEVQELKGDGWIVRNEPQDETNNWSTREDNTRRQLQDKHVEIRQKLARHAYAATVMLVPSGSDVEFNVERNPDRYIRDVQDFSAAPGSLVPAHTKWTWPATELFSVCASFDYWYTWATDARWYKGSTLRLDPAKYPKDAPQTKELWQEFTAIIHENFSCGIGTPLSSDMDDYVPFGDAKIGWSLSALHRLSKNPSAFEEKLGTGSPQIDDGYYRVDGLAAHFLTPNLATELRAEPPPLPSSEATREIDAAVRNLGKK